LTAAVGDSMRCQPNGVSGFGGDSKTMANVVAAEVGCCEEFVMQRYHESSYSSYTSKLRRQNNLEFGRIKRKSALEVSANEPQKNISAEFPG
jgi:hypothetical protein